MEIKKQNKNKKNPQKNHIVTYRESADWGVCVVVIVAIFSAFVSREALEDSEKKKYNKEINNRKQSDYFC